jgi:hypothetical protein
MKRVVLSWALVGLAVGTAQGQNQLPNLGGKGMRATTITYGEVPKKGEPPPVNPALPAAPRPPALLPPVPDTVPADGLTHFDPNLLQINWSQEGWRLRAGELVLKDFGKEQDNARQALRIIRDLRLTQYGTIGSPAPVLEYWLTNKEAPQGRVHDARVYPIDLGTLRAECSQGQWHLRDEARILFNFGLREDYAKEALALMQRHRFNRLATIGGAQPTMMVFLTEPRDHRTLPPTSMTAALQQPSLEQRMQDGQARPQDARSAFSANSMYLTPSIPPLHTSSRRDSIFDPNVYQASQPVLGARVVPGVTDLTTRTPFDSRQVRLSREGNDWVVHAGSHVFGRFGPEEKLARQALQVMNHYRFTEHCLIGQPVPRFAYFLVNGHPPQGVLFGTKNRGFQPNHLVVKQVEGKWSICEGPNTVLSLGENPAEAYHLLETIQRYRFDRLCWLGDSPERGFTFLARSR